MYWEKEQSAKKEAQLKEGKDAKEKDKTSQTNGASETGQKEKQTSTTK